MQTNSGSYNTVYKKNLKTQAEISATKTYAFEILQQNCYKHESIESDDSEIWNTNFLHFSQLYMLSPLSSSAEKNAAKQSCNVITGPQNQLKFSNHITCITQLCNWQGLPKNNAYKFSSIGIKKIKIKTKNKLFRLSCSVCSLTLKWYGW